MAKYLKKTGIRWFSDITNALDTLDSTYVTYTTSGSTMAINIGSNIVLNFTNTNNTDGTPFNLTVCGTQVASGELKLYYGEVAMEILASADYSSLKIGSNGGSYALGAVYAIEFSEDTDVYTGYKYYTGSNTFNTYTIYDLPFSLIGGGNDYAIGKVFQYSAYPGTLDYSDYTVLLASGTKVGTTTALKSCSTLAYLSTTSIGSKNYLAIGTNNLIEVDPVS